MKIKRIVAGLLFLIMLLGMGTTYAFSDAGEAISNWYDQAFLESSNKIEEEVMLEIDSPVEEFLSDIQIAAKTTENQLKDFQSKITADSEVKMKEHNQQYIQQLQVSKEKLAQQNQQDMELYKEQVKQREVNQVTQDTEAILVDLLDGEE
ncbi:hypothetical protein [Neobacillus jeddahensis]|uniref:hypothetical protein n=1 Tax=Neobacillus jeddahensis TaxID=1461580 RepID=UPI00058C172D|nr:hypothetical protein [Neobacillus jeddahensis]